MFFFASNLPCTLLTTVLSVHTHFMSVTLLKWFALHQPGHESGVSGKQMFPQGRFTDCSSLVSSGTEDRGVCRNDPSSLHHSLRYRHKTGSSLTQLNGCSNMPTRVFLRKTETSACVVAKMHFQCGLKGQWE